MSTRLRLYRNPLHQLVAGSTWRAAWFLLAYLVFGWLLWAAVLAASADHRHPGHHAGGHPAADRHGRGDPGLR